MLKEQFVAILNEAREQKKSSVLGDIDNFYDGMIAKVLALPEEGGDVPSSEVEALKAKIEEQKVEIEAMKATLEEVNQLGKAIDAKIADKPASEDTVVS